MTLQEIINKNKKLKIKNIYFTKICKLDNNNFNWDITGGAVFCDFRENLKIIVLYMYALNNTL